MEQLKTFEDVRSHTVRYIAMSNYSKLKAAHAIQNEAPLTWLAGHTKVLYEAIETMEAFVNQLSRMQSARVYVQPPKKQNTSNKVEVKLESEKTD